MYNYPIMRAKNIHNFNKIVHIKISNYVDSYFLLVDFHRIVSIPSTTFL